MKTKQRVLAALLCIVVLTAAMPCASAAPYQNYTYDIYGEPNAEPQAYIPVRVISGRDIGVGSLNEPQDILINDDVIYIADAANNRIVVFNMDGQVLHILDSFEAEGKQDAFNLPSGLFLTPDGDLYVADTGNGRVVIFNKDYSYKKMLGQPSRGEEELGYKYAPISVAVDFAQRVYIVSKNCSDGIIQFDAKGEFLGYLGAVRTNPTFSYLFWKALASEEQKKEMQLVIPTEYSAVDIDEKGFVYGTVSAIDSERFSTDMFIHRLNPRGFDVLKRNGFADPMGDVKMELDRSNNTFNISRLVDIAVMDYGFYAVLDSHRGRIFTYNRNGNLLYLFGAMGNEQGQFGNPVALAANKNRFFVLDSKYGHIVVFEPTEYAGLIQEAFIASYNRDFTRSETLWFQALKYTSKSDLVFNEIGKLYIEQGDYDKAMEYLKLSEDRRNYSEAFRYTRGDKLSRYFGILVTGILVLIAIYIVVRRIRRKRIQVGQGGGRT